MTVGAEKSIALGVSQVLGNTLDMCGTFLHYANRATLDVAYLYGALESTLDFRLVLEAILCPDSILRLKFGLVMFSVPKELILYYLSTFSVHFLVMIRTCFVFFLTTLNHFQRFS